MATVISDLRTQLSREINIPGFEQLPEITNAQMDGYIADAFWEARLVGMLGTYTLTDGSELATPPGESVIKLTADDGDLAEWLQMLVVIVAGLRILRMKMLNLAVNFKAVGGPAEYEQQASATTLRAVLAILQARYDELKSLYSTEFPSGAFVYFDAELQRESSLIQSFASLQIL